MNKYIKPYFKKNIKSIIILSIISIVYTLLALITPYYNGAFLDILISKPNLESVLHFAYFIIFLGFFSSINNYFYSLLKVKVINVMSCDIMNNMIQHLRKISLLKFNKYDPTYLNQRVNSDSIALVTFYIENYLSVFLNMFMICTITLFIYKINTYILVLSLMFIPLYIFLYFRLKRPLFKASYKFKEANNKYMNDINEQYRINEEVKVSADFTFWGRFVSNIFSVYIKEILSYNKIVYLFSSIDGLLGLLFTSGVLIVGGVQIINGYMTIGEFTIVNAYFSILIQSIQYFFELGNQYQDTKAAYIRLCELSDIKEEKNGNNIVNDIDIINVINLEHPFIAKNRVKCTFKKNKIYGIVGANGAGKTTFIRIIIGVLELPNKSGIVEVNGINLSEVDIYNFRMRNISVMTQSIQYLNITVKELLFEHLLEKTPESIIRKISELSLKHLYFNDSFNLSSLMEKRLSELSGGEKQKVLFLRTIIKDAPIYIFDEPTANLDSDSVEDIIKFLKTLKYNRIVIIITHEAELGSIFDETINL